METRFDGKKGVARLFVVGKETLLRAFTGLPFFFFFSLYVYQFATSRLDQGPMGLFLSRSITSFWVFSVMVMRSACLTGERDDEDG